MAKKFKAVITNDGKIILGKDNNFQTAQEFTLTKKAFSKNIKENNKVGKIFTIKEDNQFIQNNAEIKSGRFNQDLRNKANSIGDQKKTTANFKGQSTQPAKLKIDVDDRDVKGAKTFSQNRALTRIMNEDFDDPKVAAAFKKWSKYKGKEEKDGKIIPFFDRDADAITSVYNDYMKVKRAAGNSEQYTKNKDPEAVLEEYTDASLAASRLPKEIRNTSAVGGGTFFGKGYVGTLEKNFSTASKQAGYGEADKAYKLGWFGRPSIAAQIEASNAEALRISAEADVEQAKALREEGKERAARSKSTRIAEIAADKKASASFLNKITGGLFGRKSLADIRVEAERAQAEAALKTAKAEGKAAEESAQSVRKAIKVQSGAFGARERAQKLEARELDRLEERIAEGRPITKADQNRLKFLRDFSEQSPTSFTRGETQVRSVVAPDEDTIQAAKEFKKKKRGA